MVISSFYRLQFISFVSCTLIFFSLQQVQLLGFYSLSVSLYTLFFLNLPLCTIHQLVVVLAVTVLLKLLNLLIISVNLFFVRSYTSFFRFLFSFFYCSYLLFHVVHSIMVLFAWHKSPRFGS